MKVFQNVWVLNRAAAECLCWRLQVYVGNLMAGLVTEDALRQLFNSTMRAAYPAQCPPGMEPVVSVSLHSEGRYAFVELRTPEMASAALQLSNQVLCSLLCLSMQLVPCQGYPLSCRLPVALPQRAS